jgi:hypothetical protein
MWFSREEIFSRKGAKAQSAAAFLRGFSFALCDFAPLLLRLYGLATLRLCAFAPLRLCAFAGEIFST